MIGDNTNPMAIEMTCGNVRSTFSFRNPLLFGAQRLTVGSSFPSAFFDEFAQFFEYFVAIEQFATRSLRGAAFQFCL